MKAQSHRWIHTFLRHFGSSAAVRDRVRIDGLTAFAPVWAAAALFSIAGDRDAILLRLGFSDALLTWAAIACAVTLILRPRSERLLFLLAGLMLVRYGAAMPVASNNKMIAAFMNTGILLVAAQAFVANARNADLRDLIYDRIRVIARALLAVMYFYGIFHKINSDFLDPAVSCASALYMPLAQGFGLDGNLAGKYLAIWSTFVVEAIAIVSLYWKRYFAVGLLLALVFHFLIPISVYSWYMDFSSLVFALYVLSVPREVSATFYSHCARIFRALRMRFGEFAQLLPFGLVLVAVTAFVATLAVLNRTVPVAPSHVYQSAWVLLWVVYGGIMMILLADAALMHLPWKGYTQARAPLWVYSVPLILFIISTAPYLGLRTEASIAMFSNLHTEGGTTNHLVIDSSGQWFDYQRDVVMIRDGSDPTLQHFARGNLGLVLFSVNEYLRKNPQQWVTYDLNGTRHEKVTAASIGAATQASWFERTFLIFKPVDFARPKKCTH